MTKGAEMRKTATALVALALGLVSTIAASATIGVDLPTFPKNYYATWSPDGKRIAFTSDRLGSVDIFVMNADGTQQRPLLRTRDAEWWPAWSPDGKRLAFVSDRDGPYAQIYSLDLATGRQIRLTYADASDYQPAWSRDGRIAFRRRVYAEATDDMTSQIYVMNADGTGIHQMRADADYHLSPAWSPDASKIAYVGGDDDEAFIDVVNADGSGHVRLTTGGGEFDPAWSPDGTHIIFSRYDNDEDEDIWIMNADGSGQRELYGTSAASEYGPGFAPDARRILFSSDATGESQVYTMSAAGKVQLRLTGIARVMSSTGRRCTVVGTPARDILRGTSRDDVICGLGGDDVLRGGAGEDLLDGGAGSDSSTGGGGDDTMVGGAGDDTFEAIDGFRDSVDGGAGRDRAHVDPNDWVSSIELFR